MLRERPTNYINGSTGKFCLSLHYNGDNSYLFVNGKKTYKIKADNKNASFPTQFCLESISEKFYAAESRKLFFNGYIYIYIYFMFQSITLLFINLIY